jgi:class 3 adenylate cyclase
MATNVQHTGLLRTILFVDVCGSTKLYEALGNTRAQAVIAKTLGVLSQSAIKHLGTIVKKMGDEIMCTFLAASDAASTAVDMQQSLRQAIVRADIAVKTLQIRTGFHCGPIITKQADVFGDAVNVAARVVAYAKPGQILTTAQTLEKLPRDGAASVRYVGSTQVKGKKRPLELFEVIWERENLTLVKSVARTRRGNIRLQAKLQGTMLVLGPDRPVLRMGRGAENEFLLADPLASREHARIEYRHDRFVLVDHSLNGTYLLRRGMAEVALRRDEIALEGSGRIGLGKTTAGAQLCVCFSGRNGGTTESKRRTAEGK